MANYIKSDLEFILEQIKIAEKHAAYIANPNDPNAAPLYGVGDAGQVGSVPAYTLSLGLRTVDGSYNNLLPGQEHWGAADLPFPELLDPVFRPAQNIPPGFGPPASADQLQSLQQSWLDGFRLQPAHDLKPYRRPDAG
jgi:hypothetical protein